MNRTVGLLATAGFAAMAMLLVGSAWLSYVNVRALVEAYGWVGHTHAVLSALDGVESTVNEARLEERSFLIGGDGADLKAFEATEKAASTEVDRIAGLVSDNALQSPRVGELRSAVQATFQELRQGITARQSGGPAGAAELRMPSAATLERVLAEMRRAESGLLAERDQNSTASLQMVIGSSLLAAALGLLMIAVIHRLVVRAAVERAHASEAVAEERERFRVTLRSIGDAVIVTDDQGRVTFLNEIAQQLTGWGAEAVGEDLSTVFHIVNEETGARIENPVTRVLRENAIVGLANHTVLLSKSGGIVPIDDSGAPVRDDDGNVLGAVLVFRDITKRREEEEQRRQADAAKDEFLAMLAHELRSPLAAVRNAIAAADLEPAVRDRAIDIARRQTGRLTRLVDDLLDVARITRRKIVLRKERLVLGNIIQRCLESVRPYVEDRGQSLSITYPPEPIELDADAVRLEQTIDNLVTNAVKYTPAGGKIDLVVEREGAEAVIRVKDDGVGMERDLVPRVFDLFAQGRRTPARTDGGLGIGLTIVKLIVGLHGGTVEAKSDGPGKGSQFIVRLPALEVQREVKPAPAVVSTPTRGSKPVLVVDDNADAAEALTMLLQLLGFQAEIAHDGREALEMAGDGRRFGLMFVDIGLPGIDGYEVARRLKDVPGRSEMQVVALTGYGRDEDRSKALDAGFDLHLVKPVELETLEPLLKRLEEPPPQAASA